MMKLPSWAAAGSHIYLVGIKGVAMTSLAQMLVDLGCQVSGSDVPEEFVTQHLLAKLPIRLLEGFDGDHISADLNAVIFTGAHDGRKNVEVRRALDLGIPVLNQAEALGQLVNGQRVYAVCGVGGKSTVSAMLAALFQYSDQQVGYTVGVGNIAGLDRTGHMLSHRDESSIFVAEADEYACEPGFDSRSRFSFLEPEVIVCTNLAFDHPDVFSSFEETKDRYAEFFSKLNKKDHALLVINADDQELVALLEKEGLRDIPKLSFGNAEHADLRILRTKTVANYSEADIVWNGVEHKLVLYVPGMHNLKNALAALACAVHSGLSIEKAIAGLSLFSGTTRRFERLGEKLGAVWYDDYAHHPNEIQQTLSAMKSWEPNKKILAVFQPHTYSRTKSLLPLFGAAFKDADLVFIPDIFPSARESFDASITSEMVAAAIQHSGVHAVYSSDLEATAQRVASVIQTGDIVLTMGAGDVYKLYQMV